MSLHLVRAALETALAAVSGMPSIAWENVPFTPVNGAPYAAAFLIAVEPANIEIGASYTERGLFQVNLAYPLDTGPSAATAQAELIRAAFPRGASFASGGITTHIETTPEISSGRVEEDRFFVPVKVRWYAHVRT